MNDFWELHGRVFAQEPDILTIIFFWGLWYMLYKRRGAKQDPDPKRRHEHRKRIVIGGLTAVWGFITLPGITADYEAQKVHQQLSGSVAKPDIYGPMVAALPEQFSAETVYDLNDWYLASLIGALKKDPDIQSKLVGEFTACKDMMSVQVLDITSFKKLEKERHSDAMAMLDLTRCIPYAVHGYTFKRPLTQQFFAKFDWYHPTTEDASVAEAQFTPKERENIKMIEDFERSRWTP